MSIRLIIDSDAANEIDDQYAITYALRSEDLRICGLAAAHFGKKGSMEQSYEEIQHVLTLLGMNEQKRVFMGSPHALTAPDMPIDSPAARFIIDEAMKDGDTLHIASIGAMTNLASAFLMEPGIGRKIKVIWLAGRAWPGGGLYFNNKKDMAAAQAIFNSGIDLTLISERGIGNRLKIYRKDKKYIHGKGAIGDYLWGLFAKSLWKPKSVYDVSVIAALKSDEWCTRRVFPRPFLRSNGRYDHSRTSGEITVVTGIDTEKIRRDFFSLLGRAVQGATDAGPPPAYRRE